MARPRPDFRAVFETHRDPVYRFLVRLAGNPHDAEDLTQETFVAFWQKREDYREEGSLEGYLKRIAYRRFLNSRQRIAARCPPLSLARAPEPGTDGDEGRVEEEDVRRFFLARLTEALEELPGPARDAFLLFRFEGMTVAEVARATESPVKTVESRLRRATDLLARKMRKHRDQVTPT